MQSEHGPLEDSVAAYVLGTGEPGEGEMVRTHLEGCASCRELAARLSRAVTVLPLAVEEVEPPARLRDRILAAASADAGSQPSAPVTLPRPNVISARRISPAGGNRWLPLAAAAAILLVAGGLAGAALSRATTPGVVAAHYALRGSGQLAGASASVTDFGSAGTTLVQFSGLPALPAGRVYQLWLIADGRQATSAGVFVPEADGSKVLVLPRGLGGVGTMALTVEAGPAGATQPTQTPRLSGSV